MWDDDFDAISPGALERPHFKTQDHFGGLFSSDRMKALASSTNGGSGGGGETHHADDADRELLTIKAPARSQQQQVQVQVPDADSQEQTIRPIFHKRVAAAESSSRSADKAVARKPSLPNNSSASTAARPKSPGKSHFGAGFGLQGRLDTAYFESAEDWSDLNVENDSVFSRGVNLGVKKVSDSDTDAARQLKPILSLPPIVNGAPKQRRRGKESKSHQEADQMVCSHDPSHMQIDSSSPQLFHPSDLTSLPPRALNSPSVGGPGAANATQSASLRHGRPSTASRAASVMPEQHHRPSVVRRTRSSISIQHFAEDELDADFSDMAPSLAGAYEGGSKSSADDDDDVERRSGSAGNGGSGGSGRGQLLVLSRLSSSSWLGDDDDDDEDPFAKLSDDDPHWDEIDLEANIARDRHAQLCGKVEGLVRALSSATTTTAEAEDRLVDIGEELLGLLLLPLPNGEGDVVNEEVKDLIIGAHGLLPILEILEPCTVKNRPAMILPMLKIVNMVCLFPSDVRCSCPLQHFILPTSFDHSTILLSLYFHFTSISSHCISISLSSDHISPHFIFLLYFMLIFKGSLLGTGNVRLTPRTP